MTNPSNPFDTEEVTDLQTNEDVEVEAELAEDGDVPEVKDLDVDAATEDEEKEEVDEKPAAAPGAKAADKEPKKPARPSIADGYITPVAFAKALTAHLEAKGESNRTGLINDKNPITSQMIYSYIKNSTKDNAKNPWPTYDDPTLTGGRALVLKLDESLAWWDAKNDRVAASKVKAAEKAEKAAAAKAEADKKAAEAPATTESTEVVEAE
jgi:hypothetical protein